MEQVAEGSKIEEWTRRLGRFEVAGETIARFCRREGVSESAFYAWKQKLRLATTPAGATPPAGASPRFLPVEIAPSQPASAHRAGEHSREPTCIGHIDRCSRLLCYRRQLPRPRSPVQSKGWTHDPQTTIGEM